MRYGMGESLADFGFGFLEKLHEPIFLVNKQGYLIKSNEAGRKFLRLSRWSGAEIETFIKKSVLVLFRTFRADCRRVSLEKRGHVIARSFAGSDLLLIELVK